MILLIILINLLTWGKIFNQSILGEGYYYFDLQQSLISDGKINIDKYDVFARIIFDILAPIFKDNISLYLIFQFLVMMMVTLTVYFVFLKISKSKFVAVFTTLIFSINYVASYEIMAIGNYQRFVQRVPNFPFLIISLWFLYKYLESRKLKDYLISFSLFSIGMFVAHYSIFLLPVFVIFPIVNLLRGKSKNITMNIIVSLSFILVSILMISNDPHAAQNGIIEIQQVLVQFTNITIPTVMIIKIAKLLHILHPYKNLVTFLSIPVITFYCLGLFVVKRKMQSISVLYLTGLLSLPVIFSLNLVAGRMDPLTNFGQDRYYYYPSVISSFLIASITFSFVKFRRKLKYIAIVLLGISLIYNFTEINQQIDAIQYKSEAIKKYLVYIKSISPHFTNETIIATTSSLIWPESMIVDIYEKPIKFIAFEEGWEAKIPRDKIKNTFVIDYDYEKLPGEDFNPRKGKLIDLTDKFRKGEKIEYIK